MFEGYRQHEDPCAERKRTEDEEQEALVFELAIMLSSLKAICGFSICPLPDISPFGTVCRRKMASRAQQYLDGIAQLHSRGTTSLVNVILFGSVAGGAFSEASDVDLLIVISDETVPEDRRLLRNAVRDLEIMQGLRLPESRPRNPLEMFAEHAGGHGHSCFFCTRGDLNSGEVAGILGLRAT